MHVEPVHSPHELRELARKQEDLLLVIRLYGVALAMEKMPATYYILHRLGYKDPMPHPRHKNVDPAAQGGAANTV